VPGRSRSQLRKAQKVQEHAEPDWRIREKCFSCGEGFVVNNYEDRKVRLKKHTFQGKIICPWCWRRGGRKLAQAAYLLEKLCENNVEELPYDPWVDDPELALRNELTRTVGKVQRTAAKVMASWG